VTFDDLVKICCDFYTTDEIVNAGGVISKYVQHRLPPHRGSDTEKSKKTVTDISKCILDPQLSLPQFCCINLARMPPVTADHVDVAAMWLEISQLRDEVRAVAELRHELRSMKTALEELRLSSFPPLPTTNSTVVEVNHAAKNYVSVPTTADVARAAVQSGALRRQRPIRQVVVGSKANDKVKPVVTRRRVEVFISRLHPDTTIADVEQCTTDALMTDDDFNTADVHIATEQLQTKHNFYASYHVAVTVCADSFARSIEILVSGSSWPEGILVRRFYPKREQNGSRCPRTEVVFLQLSFNEEQFT